MSIVLNVADAVVAELASATFSQTFTAERRVLPLFDLPELATLHVTVVPKAVDIASASRSMAQYDVRVDIGFQKRLGVNVETEVVGLLTVVEEVADYLRRRVLATAPWAVWVHMANDPVYAPAHLAEQRVFTSVLTLTYRAVKQ